MKPPRQAESWYHDDHADTNQSHSPRLAIHGQTARQGAALEARSASGREAVWPELETEVIEMRNAQRHVVMVKEPPVDYVIGPDGVVYTGSEAAVVDSKSGFNPGYQDDEHGR